MIFDEPTYTTQMIEQQSEVFIDAVCELLNRLDPEYETQFLDLLMEELDDF